MGATRRSGGRRRPRRHRRRWAEAAEADARADELFAQALRNNQRGDNYTLLTVLFALVLFFTAVSQRLRSAPLGWAVLVGAIVLMIAGIGFLLAFPKLI